MTAQQTSVGVKAIAYAGMISDASRDSNLRSYTSEEASAEIPFGVFVGQGTNDNGMLLLAATSDGVVGLLVNSQAFARDVEVGDTGLKPKMTAQVMTRGRAYAWVEEAVTPASLPLIRCIAVGSEKAGALRDTADASDCVNASSWMRFLGTTTGAGFVEVEFDVANRGADPTD